MPSKHQLPPVSILLRCPPSAPCVSLCQRRDPLALHPGGVPLGVSPPPGCLRPPLAEEHAAVGGLQPSVRIAWDHHRDGLTDRQTSAQTLSPSQIRLRTENGFRRGVLFSPLLQQRSLNCSRSGRSEFCIQAPCFGVLLHLLSWGSDLSAGPLGNMGKMPLAQLRFYRTGGQPEEERPQCMCSLSVCGWPHLGGEGKSGGCKKLRMLVNLLCSDWGQ